MLCDARVKKSCQYWCSSCVLSVQVLFTGVVRKLMEGIFTQHELKYLDDLLPTKKKGKGSKEAELERQSDAKVSRVYFPYWSTFEDCFISCLN